MRWAIALLLALTLGAPAQAQSFYTPVATPQVGFSVGQSDFNGIFINWFKTCGSYIFDGSATPRWFDANSYPNQIGTIPAGSDIFCQMSGLPSSSYYSGTWEIGFTGTGALGLGTTLTSVVNPAPSPVITNPNTCTFSGNILSGTNCDIQFSFSGGTPSALDHRFEPGTYSNMGNAFLIRTSDKASYVAGKSYTPEWISTVQGAAFLRTMGFSFPLPQSVANSTGWKYRMPVASFTYNVNTYPPNIQAGTDSTNTDNYVFTSYPDMPAQWTDSEVFQIQVANASNAQINVSAAANDGGVVELTASTSALSNNQNVLVANCESNASPTSYAVTIVDSGHLTLQGSTYSSAWSSCSAGIITTTTINVGNRGAKFAVTETILGAPAITANTIWTCHYDALLNLVPCASGGINAGLPPEQEVEMANEAGTPLWQNIPPYYQTSDVTSLVSYGCANTKNDYILEFNNEDWNFSFQAQVWQQRGYALGLPQSGNNALYSYIGLRYRQLFAAATSACGKGAGHFHRVNAGQEGNTASAFQTYQFNGQSLCGTSCGNSTYAALGLPDYNSAPNRPKDFTDDYSTATYWNAVNGNNGNLAANQPLIFAANEYANGDLGDAFAWLDGQERSIISTNTQPDAFAPWNVIAVADGKNYRAYEGGYSDAGPTAAYLTGIGDTGSGSCTGCNGGTTDATNINNMLVAYRESSLFFSTYVYWNGTFLGNSNTVANSNLQVQGSTININAQFWGLLEGGIFPSVQYQNGVAAQMINQGLLH